jgi:class 3 adenylate cyclase
MAYVFTIGSRASEDRLEKLIEERIKPNADKKAVDERIWDLFGEEWAIMFTDLSGFSRQVAEFGIIHFLQTIQESKKMLVPCIDDHDGILLKMEGDSMLVIFKNPHKALDCAIAMQRATVDYNKMRPDTEKVLLCIGLGKGRILRIGDSDVYGAEVNAASKLGEDTAKSGDILVTGSIMKSIGSAFKFMPIDAIPPGADSAFKLIYKA